MAIMDVFGKENRAEITVSQLYDLLKESARADLFRNGVKNKIPYEHILAVLDGGSNALSPSEASPYGD